MSHIVTLLRRRATQAATGKSNGKLYEDIKDGLFPAPVKISERAVAWPDNEIAAINAARIAGKTDDQIRELVGKLKAARGGDAAPINTPPIAPKPRKPAAHAALAA